MSFIANLVAGAAMSRHKRLLMSEGTVVASSGGDGHPHISVPIYNEKAMQV